jgi:hypothetical protein
MEDQARIRASGLSPDNNLTHTHMLREKPVSNVIVKKLLKHLLQPKLVIRAAVFKMHMKAGLPLNWFKFFVQKLASFFHY